MMQFQLTTQQLLVKTLVNTTNSLSIQNSPLAVVAYISIVQWGVVFPIQTAIQHLSCDSKKDSNIYCERDALPK